MTTVASPETLCEQTLELPSVGELPAQETSVSGWALCAQSGYWPVLPASHKRRRFWLPRRLRLLFAALLMTVVIRGGSR